MRYVSLFSGIEAATVAWEPLGWEPMAFAEVDLFPCAVLAHRWPNVPNLGDVCKIDWKNFVETNGKPDVIVGGSPCQSFSIAGGREGLDGESRLMYEYIRAVREVRPPWFLWENVPGVFSTDAGRAFGILLDAMAECGYGLAWRVLDAQFFGVAQRRRRVFLVGHLGDSRAAAVLFDAESVRGNTCTGREKRKSLTRTATFGSAGFKHAAGAKAGGVGYVTEQAPTLQAEQESAVLAFDTTQITSPANGDRPQFGDPNSAICASKHVPTIAIQSDGATSKNSNGDGIQTDGSAYTLNCIDRQSVMCMANTTANTSIDEDVSGSLLANGGGCLTSNGQDVVGALLARDYKGVGSEYVDEGKVICQKAKC